MIPPAANNEKNNGLAQGIDVLEESVLSLDDRLLKILLSDHTTQKNIIWATADYAAVHPYTAVHKGGHL